MKKMTIAALCCGLAGAALMGIGAGNASSLEELASWPEVRIGNAGGFFINMHNHATITTSSQTANETDDGESMHEYRIDSAAAGIEIEADRGDLRIEKADGDQLLLAAQNLPPKGSSENGRKISWKVENRKLKVKIEDNTHQDLSGDEDQPVLVLSVPKKLDSLSLKTSLGQISLDGIESQQCSLATSLGAIQLEDVSLDSVSGYTALGNIEITSGSISNGGFETSMGDIEIEGTVLSSRLEASTALGDVEVILPKGSGQSDLAKADVTLQTSHGEISYENAPVQSENGISSFTRSNPDASLVLHLETASGNISLLQE